MYNYFGHYPYYNQYPPNYDPFYHRQNYWNPYNRNEYQNYYNQNRRNYPMNRNRYYIGENGLEDRKENYKEETNFRRGNYGNSRNSYNYNNERNDYNKFDRYNDNNDRYYSYNNNYNRYNRGYWREVEEKKDNKKSENDLILDYENTLRKEIELTTPLISDELPISKLTEEYKSNEEYLKSIENISKKYKTYRKVRRDGNCFYRSFIYRLFEQACIRNDKILFEKIKQKIIESKKLTEKNGYEWAVVQDFYEIFLKEFTECFNSLSKGIIPREYLDKLFSDNEKGNYMIYFIRFCLAAYLKENKENYKSYIEIDFDEWVRKEVEAIDHVADQIQIMACVNYFDVGVKIEYLNKFKNEVVKLPENKPDNEFFIYLLFSPGHYDILYP
jgi:hypothetical protein